MKKIVYIGNGFDLAHKLKTSYEDFVDNKKYVNNESIRTYRDLLNKMEKSSLDKSEKEKTEWYWFEDNIQYLAQDNYNKGLIEEPLSEEYIASLDIEMGKLNELFSEISNLIKEYISEEYNNHVIIPIDNIKQEFDGDTIAISFNYTDTVKLYTDKYEYIHGSIEMDNEIIFGFANEDEMPCPSGGNTLRFSKSALRERLNFIRFIRSRKTNNEEKLMREFEKHLFSLISGYGGYNEQLLDIYDKTDDTDDSFKLISEYASLNGGRLAKDNHDYSDVEEIVIMGHGLNSDKRYFADVFEKCVKLKKIVYYTHIKDNGEINNVDKQIEFLKHISGLNEVEIKTYTQI